MMCVSDDVSLSMTKDSFFFLFVNCLGWRCLFLLVWKLPNKNYWLDAHPNPPTTSIAVERFKLTNKIFYTQNVDTTIRQYSPNTVSSKLLHSRTVLPTNKTPHQKLSRFYTITK